MSEEEHSRKQDLMIDELLQAPYYVIDILPEQVPADSPGQFFAVEKYFIEHERMSEIKQKHINTILRLNCYADISIDEGETWNPTPEQIAHEMRSRWLYVMLRDAMILSEPDDTHMTIFNPGERLLELVTAIAGSEGLFVWKPPQDTEKD